MKAIKQILKEKIAKIYKFFKIMYDQIQYEEIIKNGILQIGCHTYGRPTVHVYKGSESRVIIGNFCSISPGVVMITGGIHCMNWVSSFPFRIRWKMDGAFQDGMPYTKGDIIIGSDVWIGTDAMILSGVTIGDGAIIASRSVVTENIPPYAIVAGISAKIIRFRFNQDAVEQLLRIKWWE